MDFVQGDIVRYIGTNDDLHGIDYGKLLIVSDCIFKSQEMYISMLSTDVNDINVYEAAPQYLELVDKESVIRTISYTSGTCKLTATPGVFKFVSAVVSSKNVAPTSSNT